MIHMIAYVIIMSGLCAFHLTCESEIGTNTMSFHRIFPLWFAEVPYDKITDCDVQETDTQ